MTNPTPSHDHAEMAELLPCPFCGNAKEHTLWDGDDDDDDDGSGKHWTVVCDASNHHHGCGANSGYKSTQKEAVREWNRRVKYERETFRQQLATAEKTIAELRERVEAAEIRAEAAEACHVESSDIDEDTINYLRDRVLAAERTCEELKAKCGELFAREQALKDELLSARTADQITNRGS